MEYILYKTTNKINGMYYIGKHCQESEGFDGYLGSGIYILRAIKKYGQDNFTRVTINKFDDEEKAYLAEVAEIGNLWETDPKCYNKSPGGYGQGKGFKMPVGATAKRLKSREGYQHSTKTKAKMSIAQSGKNNPMYGKKHSDQAKHKLSLFWTGKKKKPKFEYITPWGKFTTAASAATNSVSAGSIWLWCNNNNKKISNGAIAKTKYLEEHLGKTFKELGFELRVL